VLRSRSGVGPLPLGGRDGDAGRREDESLVRRGLRGTEDDDPPPPRTGGPEPETGRGLEGQGERFSDERPVPAI